MEFSSDWRIIWYFIKNNFYKIRTNNNLICNILIFML
jgi:hypothetical protein